MQQRDGLNSRILVIDDEESVRDSFLTVLSPEVRQSASLSAAASALFGDVAPAPARTTSIPFEVEVAANGRDGLWLVESSLEKQRPYAAIFCDMRMPGWDGIETIERIRKLDQRAEIVFVTAYSDHSLETIVERTGANVGYFVKPFLTDEVKQLATKLVLDWNKARELEDLMRTVTALRGDVRDVERVVEHLLRQICDWLDTDSAALIRLMPDGKPTFQIGVGRLRREAEVSPLLAIAADTRWNGQVKQLADGTALLPIQEYGFALALSGGKRLTADRRFLLQVFLEHASLAIKNSEMHALLVEHERLVAVGQAVAFVVHDLRGPIGTAQTLLSMLRAGKRSLGPPEQVLERVEANMKRAMALLGDTLAFCRDKVEVTPRLVALSQTLAETIHALRLDLEAKGVILELDLPPDLEIWADPDRLWRVVWNLVRNATEAAAENTAPVVALRARATLGGVEVDVEDNGSGIPEEIAATLFQPFVTAGKRDGSGFGLAIVRQVVEAHGGKIGYTRDKAVSRFRAFFPAPTGPPAAG